MCGIAGLIHRNGSGNIGQEMTQMLQSLKHRGPDSTGYAIYGTPGRNEFVMRFKVAEQEDMAKGFDIIDEVKRRRAKVEERLSALGVQIIDKDDVTEYAYRYRIQYDGDMKKLADYVGRSIGPITPAVPLDGQRARAYPSSGRCGACR